MHRLVAATLGILAFVPAVVFAQDPVKVDPAHHKVELENADVRVLRFKSEPGERAPEHEHPNSVAIFLSDGRQPPHQSRPEAYGEPAEAR